MHAATKRIGWGRSCNIFKLLPRTSVHGTRVVLQLIHRSSMYSVCLCITTTHISTTSSRIALKIGRHSLKAEKQQFFFISTGFDGQQIWHPEFLNFQYFRSNGNSGVQRYNYWTVGLIVLKPGRPSLGSMLRNDNFFYHDSIWWSQVMGITVFGIFSAQGAMAIQLFRGITPELLAWLCWNLANLVWGQCWESTIFSIAIRLDGLKLWGIPDFGIFST